MNQDWWLFLSAVLFAIGASTVLVRRIRDGAIKAPLPAPGVFARHNAVDTPALLPDGTPSELSVSRVLTARGQNLSAADRLTEIRTIDAEVRSPLGADDAFAAEAEDEHA